MDGNRHWRVIGVGNCLTKPQHEGNPEEEVYGVERAQRSKLK